MRARHPCRLPRRWLMTDARLDGALCAILGAIPEGSGVILRHYGASLRERRAMLGALRGIAVRKRLTIVVGGRHPLGRGAVGSHGRHPGALTAPVHSRREAVAAIRAGAKLLFVSPVHSTRSHPGAHAMGRVRLGLMIRGLTVPVIALGGMNERRWRAIAAMGIYGWAGIDAWLTRRRPLFKF